MGKGNERRKKRKWCERRTREEKNVLDLKVKGKRPRGRVWKSWLKYIDKIISEGKGNDSERNRRERSTRGIEAKGDRGETITYRLLYLGWHSGTTRQSNWTRIPSCASDPRVPTIDPHIISSVQTVAAPSIWNELSTTLKSSESLSSFRKKISIHIFSKWHFHPKSSAVPLLWCWSLPVRVFDFSSLFCFGALLSAIEVCIIIIIN